MFPSRRMGTIFKSLPLTSLLLFTWLSATGDEFLQRHFGERSYLAGIQAMESEAPSNLERQTHLAVLYSAAMSQAWEEQAPTLRLLNLVRRYKKHSQACLEIFPDRALGYVGMGEYCQYLPAWLGGGITKSERYFKLCLERAPRPYDLYKVLLFYLNSKNDTVAARPILQRIRQALPSEKGFLRDYVTKWVVYQEGVLLYEEGKKLLSRPFFEKFIQLEPGSHWGYFMLWKVSSDPTLLPLIKTRARAHRQFRFLKRLEKERG